VLLYCVSLPHLIKVKILTAEMKLSSNHRSPYPVPLSFSAHDKCKGVKNLKPDNSPLNPTVSSLQESEKVLEREREGGIQITQRINVRGSMYKCKRVKK
jgi:hypothetical protein